MRKFWKFFSISAVLLSLCLSVQAQPVAGTWTTDDDFLPGSWVELLYGGGEGQPGNEIQATNGSDYEFYGATIGPDPGDVVLTQDCADPDFVAVEYRTFYYGGMLTLSSGSPWGTGGDPDYAVTMGPIKNITTKNVEGAGSCEPTGEIAFDLTGVGVFDAYPEYAALVTAHYSGPALLDDSGPTPFLYGDLTSAEIMIAQLVPVVVKPGSCLNPVNVKSMGVIPVVLMGSEEFDVSTVDPSALTLEGVSPAHWAWEDAGAPIEPMDGMEEPDCSDQEMPDGYMDLVLKFSTQEVLAAIAPVEDGDMIALTLLGQAGEVPILGQDTITILKRGRIRVANGDEVEEPRDYGNHFGWTIGNGNAYGRHKDDSTVLGRGRSEGGKPDDVEENGNRGNGNANGHGKDNGNNGKENGADQGNGKKNGHNKNGG